MTFGFSYVRVRDEEARLVELQAGEIPDPCLGYQARPLERSKAKEERVNAGPDLLRARLSKARDYAVEGRKERTLGQTRCPHRGAR